MLPEAPLSGRRVGPAQPAQSSTPCCRSGVTLFLLRHTHMVRKWCGNRSDICRPTLIAPPNLPVALVSERSRRWWRGGSRQRSVGSGALGPENLLGLRFTRPPNPGAVWGGRQLAWRTFVAGLVEFWGATRTANSLWRRSISQPLACC